MIFVRTKVKQKRSDKLRLIYRIKYKTMQHEKKNTIE